MIRFPALSLRGHLLSLVVLAMLPVVGILLYSGLDRQREALLASRQFVEAQSTGVAEEQRRLVDGLHQQLLTLAELPEVRNRDRQACDGIFARLVSQNPRVATLFATTPDALIFAANAPFSRISIADRKYFQDALRTHSFSCGEFVVSRLTQKQVLHFALPVLEGDARLVTVLVAGIDLTALDTLFQKLDLPRDSRLAILDHRGTILHETTTGIESLGTQVSPEQFNTLLEAMGNGSFREPSPEGTRLVSVRGLFLSGSRNPYMLVKVSVPERAILAGPRQDFLRNMFLLLAVAASAGLAAWMLGEHRLVAPIHRLMARMDQLTHGGRSTLCETFENAPEIGRLATAIDAMAEALQKREQEQEETRNTLLASQQLLDLFFSQSLDGFYIATIAPPLRWDDTVDKAAAVESFLDGMRMERVNAAMLLQYGATEQDFLGKSIRDFYAHDPEFARKMVREFLDRGRMHQETHEHKADGTPLWIEGDYLCMYDAEGLVTGHFGIQRDVTQRKEAERELRTSEQKFRAIFDNAFQLIGLLDTDGTVLEVNRTSIDFIGASEGDVLGRPFWETPWWGESQEERQRLHAAIAEASQGGLVRFEATHRDKEGVLHTVDVSLKPFQDEEDIVRFLIAEGRDITERKRTEETLKEREQLFRLLFERSGDANLLIDGNLFVDCNEATVKLLGAQTKEEILNTHPSKLSPPVQPDGRDSREKADAMITTAFQRGSQRFEWVHLKLDGTEFPVDVMLTAIPWQGKWILHTAWRDLSEQKRAEEARRSLEGQMQQTQRLESLGVLAGGIAHDFNNLLTALLGNLNLAHMCLHEESPANPYLASAETTVLRASELIKQMLAYSGKGRFVVKLHDLNHVVQEMTHLLQVSLPKKINLHYHLAEDLPPIEADSAQIQQVILNLVTNASDAIGVQEGTITLRTEAPLLDSASIASDFPSQALVPGHFVILEVRDTGGGIPRDIMARIFEPFFTTKPTGRGLGLSAMLGILRGHHAGIQIQSELGIGTTFRLAFPAGKGLVDEPVREKAPSVTPSQGTVLLVDDEPMILEMAQAALSRMGCQVVVARDGLEALEAFRAHHGEINLVVMDLTMPRMDGLEAFEAMRQIHPGIRVILSSGYSEQDSVPLVLGKGLAGFLQKPYTLKDLRKIVEESLERPS